MGDAQAVLEMEVLLGRRSGKAMAIARAFFQAAKRGDTAEGVRLLHECNGPDLMRETLLQRDGCGNVPLHHANNLKCAELIFTPVPSSKQVKNFKQQTPLHTFLTRIPDDEGAIKLLAEDPYVDILACDADGISPAMLSTGKARKFVEDFLPGWSAIEDALKKRLDEVSGALDAVHCHWP